MKNNTFFKLFIVILIAILLRLWFIDKPEGLWNDEYVSWYIASQKTFSDFLSEMLKNCHTPLYYLYLKFWMLFSDTDYTLRISSVIPSIFSVIVMYLVGKEVKDSKLGLLCAFLATISSFNIYFAQEVRLYSLLFLFSSCGLLYFIKTIQKPSKLNLSIYFIINALICSLHTLGIIFSAFNILGLFVYQYKYNDIYREKFKKIVDMLKYLLPFFAVIVLISPFLFTIASSNSLSQFWSNFSLTKLIYICIDYLSPIQTNIVNTPDDFLVYLYKNNKINYVFFIFAIIPTTIGLLAIARGILEKNKILNTYFVSAILFLLTLTLLSFIGKIILITKYTSEMYPIILLLLALGLTSIKKEKIKVFSICIFIGLNLFYLLVATDSAPKKTRIEGHLAVVKLLENSRLKNTDFVLLTYYDVDKFERYLKSKEQYKFNSINKSNFHHIIFQNNDYFETVNYGKTIYKNHFREFPNEVILQYAKENFISKMNKGDRIGLIFLESVSFLSNDKIQNVINDYKEYERTPFIFITFSALKNNLLYAFKDSCKIDSITQSGEWTLFVFQKIN